jgi:hypothetical protein
MDALDLGCIKGGALLLEGPYSSRGPTPRGVNSLRGQLVAEGGKLAPGRVNTSSADRPEESMLVCQTSERQKGNIAVMKCEWDER